MTDNIIIIKNIPSYYLNNIIINQFKDIGNINNYIIFILSNLKQKIIFIEYSQSLEADIAVVVLDKVIPTGGEDPLYVNYAEKSLLEERLINDEDIEDYNNNNNNNNNNNHNNNDQNNVEDNDEEINNYNYFLNQYNLQLQHNDNSIIINDKNIDDDSNLNIQNENYDGITSSENSSIIHHQLSDDYNNNNNSKVDKNDDSNYHHIITSTFPTTLLYKSSFHSIYSNSFPILQVTFRGVPPNIDIMSFSFLKTFGTVLEGRMVEDTLNLYSPDGTCCLTPVYTGVVMFTILTHSMLSAENLMILNGSIAMQLSFFILVTISII